MVEALLGLGWCCLNLLGSVVQFLSLSRTKIYFKVLGQMNLAIPYGIIFVVEKMMRESIRPSALYNERRKCKDL